IQPRKPLPGRWVHFLAVHHHRPRSFVAQHPHRQLQTWLVRLKDMPDHAEHRLVIHRLPLDALREEKQPPVHGRVDKPDLTVILELELMEQSNSSAPTQTQGRRAEGLTLRQGDSPRLGGNAVMVSQYRGQANNPPDLFRRQLAVESLTQVLGKVVLPPRPALPGPDNHPLTGDRMKSTAHGRLRTRIPQIPPCLAPQVSPIVVARHGTLSEDG